MRRHFRLHRNRMGHFQTPHSPLVPRPGPCHTPALPVLELRVDGTVRPSFVSGLSTEHAVL